MQHRAVWLAVVWLLWQQEMPMPCLGSGCPQGPLTAEQLGWQFLDAYDTKEACQEESRSRTARYRAKLLAEAMRKKKADETYVVSVDLRYVCVPLGLHPMDAGLPWD